METAVVTSKPPLPQPVSTHRAEEATDGSAFSLSIYQQHLRTSQMETMSDGTILGLRDIIYQNEPDLTYYCSLCNRFVSLLLLKDHKTYHNALSLLEFHYPPSSLKSLLNRRTAILKRLKDNASLEETTLTLKTIQLINDSYEIVKQEIEDTFECCRKIEENINTKVEGSHLGCCLDFVSAVGCCSDQNSRWKQAMEDCKVYQDYYGNDKGRAFVALYDGYNGSYAASVAANELHYLLLMEMAKFDKTIKCKCTFNMLERNDVTKYDLIESPAKPCQHKRQLHRQSANFLHQVIYTCEELDYEGTNHLSSHHPIRKDLSTNKQSEVAHGVAERKDEKTTHRQHMKAALRRAYQLTDEVLSFGGDERSKVRWSGCSAVTVVMENVDNSESCPASPSSDKLGFNTSDKVGGKSYEEPRPIGRLYLANTGNCHAVLVRDNRAYQLTKSHTYENLRERSRVLSAGGTFSQSEREMRVNGVLLTTRGLGNHGDPTIKQLISCEPHCAAVEVDQYAQLLIVATPGIWQVFSPQEAAELLLQVLPQNRIPTPGYISPSISSLKNTQNAAQNEAEEKQTDPVNVVADSSTRPAPLIDGSAREGGLSPDAAFSTHRTSVTFQDEQTDTVGGKVKVGGEEVKVGEEKVKVGGEEVTGRLTADVLDEDDEEDELIEIRSNDSGNDADVDTDWASTIPPSESAARSALSVLNSDYKHLSRVLSERLVQSALLAGAKDNISAIVVVLQGTKLPQ